jgi:F0F1-type ATP synthase membrane subunit a
MKTKALIILALVGAAILFNWHFNNLSDQRLSNIHYRVELNSEESTVWVAEAIKEDIDDYKKRVVVPFMITQFSIILILGINQPSEVVRQR